MLKVLCAGVSKDDREQAESVVRRALGKRAAEGGWTVSLVGIGDKWSVTLDAPVAGIRARNFLTPRRDLGQALLEALEGPASPLPGVPAGPGVEARTPCQCEKCRQSFVVVYEGAADEGQEAAPVACPHCWHVNRALVGERAAEARDYRAEKA